ncbi:HPP family protein [Novosphingobium flavum]|uniref:HPP family protein n=1 Tax=Novosphingobium flavum TaxID=1778672 RepID=A0A7X1FPQ0_9SPHN|nr:HPP family protein [Novosphingobium flavum]MBC2664569.1 HPP family protein [Novosphingobium flavum]
MLARAASRATGRLGWLRGSIGALCGIAVAALAGRLLATALPAFPWLLAPLGASAVLVFAVPASPLAQPWPVIGGNMLSALTGLAVHALVPGPLLAAALGVAAAIAVMSMARCLHPPGGACALLGAMASPAVAAHGWGALLLPLAVNLAALALAGWLYNTLTGHSWPHRKPAPRPEPTERYETSDLDAVLEEWDEVLDVSREDLDALIRAVERRVAAKLVR